MLLYYFTMLSGAANTLETLVLILQKIRHHMLVDVTLESGSMRTGRICGSDRLWVQYKDRQNSDMKVS